jgi:hypothetical protein
VDSGIGTEADGAGRRWRRVAAAASMASGSDSNRGNDENCLR